MNNVFAKKKGDVSKAAIDFFSFGHTLAGYLIFLILDALFLVIFGEFVILLCFFTIFLFGVFWEIIENTYFFKKNIKFGYRRDSLLNSSMDIIMLTIGGAIASLFLELNQDIFLIITAFFYIGNILLMSLYANWIMDLFSSVIKKKKKN
ncbi:unnamed protein product [marine sediment metagenome]|uniref:DUF2585 family protein n=1 Tax=marine sediment metagenome TaxID=412755 RepID=X1DWI7_9ZZZZ